MKLAIIGSRSLTINNFEDYIPKNVTEIVSGGAKGIDRQAAEYALRYNIKLTEFLPEYAGYGRCAPLKRNEKIAEYADSVLACWDGTSKGTAYTLALFEKLGKDIKIVQISH